MKPAKYYPQTQQEHNSPEPIGLEYYNNTIKPNINDWSYDPVKHAKTIGTESYSWSFGKLVRSKVNVVFGGRFLCVAEQPYFYSSNVSVYDLGNLTHCTIPFMRSTGKKSKITTFDYYMLVELNEIVEEEKKKFQSARRKILNEEKKKEIEKYAIDNDMTFKEAKNFLKEQKKKKKQSLKGRRIVDRINRSLEAIKFLQSLEAEVQELKSLVEENAARPYPVDFTKNKTLERRILIAEDAIRSKKRTLKKKMGK